MTAAIHLIPNNHIITIMISKMINSLAENVGNKMAKNGIVGSV